MHTRNEGLTQAYITSTFVREPAWIAASRAQGERLRPGMRRGGGIRWVIEPPTQGAKWIIGRFPHESRHDRDRAAPPDDAIGPNMKTAGQSFGIDGGHRAC